MSDIERINEIERAVAEGTMDAAQVFTQMRQLVKSRAQDGLKLATGDAIAMGDLEDEDGGIYEKSMLIQFANVDDFHAARKAGQCRFTGFGGDL
jgi:hypothetical protein